MEKMHGSETIITKRKNGSRRIQIIFHDPSLTDQSMKKACDINNILKQYATQGVKPQAITDPSFYRDNTNIPEPSKAYETVIKLSNAFSELPPDIRKLMDNDPMNLPGFLENPKNHDLLTKYGVLIPKQAPLEPNKELKGGASSSSTPKVSKSKVEEE